MTRQASTPPCTELTFQILSTDSTPLQSLSQISVQEKSGLPALNEGGEALIRQITVQTGFFVLE